MNAFLTVSHDYSRAQRSLRVTAYENVIGAPTSARSTRKAKTADLRPRFRAVDVLLEGMDDLIIQITGTEEKGLFVEGYFNARRIGGSSSVAGKKKVAVKAAAPLRRRRIRPRRTRKYDRPLRNLCGRGHPVFVPPSLSGLQQRLWL